MKVSRISHYNQETVGTMTIAFVESSVIASFYWSSGNKIIPDALGVTFNSGKTYRYREVPATVFHELLASESVGNVFNKIVRDKYEFAIL